MGFALLGRGRIARIGPARSGIVFVDRLKVSQTVAESTKTSHRNWWLAVANYDAAESP
jgi:hypothetical protein